MQQICSWEKKPYKTLILENLQGMKVEKVQNYKILIVEDDRGLAQGIAMALKEENTLFLQA